MSISAIVPSVPAANPAATPAPAPDPSEGSDTGDTTAVQPPAVAALPPGQGTRIDQIV